MRDQKVLLTAGASGIGRAMAEAFAADGNEVWVTGISESHLESCPPDWHRHPADVTDEVKVAKIIADMGDRRALRKCRNRGPDGAHRKHRIERLVCV